MPNYEAMYKTLFQAQTKAIEILQESQQDTEEMYITAPAPDIRLLPAKEQEETANNKK
jgi:hypothetical protein